MASFVIEAKPKVGFFDLPSEIRNCVYEALIEDIIPFIHDKFRYGVSELVYDQPGVSNRSKDPRVTTNILLDDVQVHTAADPNPSDDWIATKIDWLVDATARNVGIFFYQHVEEFLEISHRMYDEIHGYFTVHLSKRKPALRNHLRVFGGEDWLNDIQLQSQQYRLPKEISSIEKSLEKYHGIQDLSATVINIRMEWIQDLASSDRPDLYLLQDRLFCSLLLSTPFRLDLQQTPGQKVKVWCDRIECVMHPSTHKAGFDMFDTIGMEVSYPKIGLRFYLGLRTRDTTEERICSEPAFRHGLQEPKKCFFHFAVVTGTLAAFRKLQKPGAGELESIGTVSSTSCDSPDSHFYAWPTDQT